MNFERQANIRFFSMVREKKRVKFIGNEGEKEMENVEEDKLGEKIKVGYVKKKMKEVF